MGLGTLKVGTKGLCQGKADKLVKEPLDLLSNSPTVFWEIESLFSPFPGTRSTG